MGVVDVGVLGLRPVGLVTAVGLDLKGKKVVAYEIDYIYMH